MSPAFCQQGALAPLGIKPGCSLGYRPGEQVFRRLGLICWLPGSVCMCCVNPHGVLARKYWLIAVFFWDFLGVVIFDLAGRNAGQGLGFRLGIMRSLGACKGPCFEVWLTLPITKMHKEPFQGLLTSARELHKTGPRRHVEGRRTLLAVN